MTKRILMAIVCWVSLFTNAFAFTDLVNASIAQLDLNEKRIVEKWVRDSISPKDTSVFRVAIPMERENEPGVCDLLLVELSRPRRDIIRAYTDSAKIFTRGLSKTTALKYDFGNYILNDTTRAFGIRIKDSMQTNVYLAKSETLTLYVPKGNTMVKVMDNFILNSVNDNWNLQNCEGDHFEERKVVIMDRKTPNADLGYRDILVKNRVVSVKNFFNPNAIDSIMADASKFDTTLLTQIALEKLDSVRSNSGIDDSLFALRPQMTAEDSLEALKLDSLEALREDSLARLSAEIQTQDSAHTNITAQFDPVPQKTEPAAQQPETVTQQPEPVAQKPEPPAPQQKPKQKKGAVVRYSNGFTIEEADPNNMLMHTMLQDISAVNLDSITNIIMAEKERKASMDGESLDEYKIEQFSTNSDCIEATTIEWMREYYEFKDGLYTRSKRTR